MLQIYVPKYTCKEKSGGYSVCFYSRIASIEHALNFLQRIECITVICFFSVVEYEKHHWSLCYGCSRNGPQLRLQSRLGYVNNVSVESLSKQQMFLIHGRLPEVKFQASHLLRMPGRFREEGELVAGCGVCYGVALQRKLVSIVDRPETLFYFAQSTFVITRQLGLLSHCIRVE